MHLRKVTILHISLRSIAEYFAKNSLRSLAKFFAIIRFAHLAKEVTFKGQFCIFRFAQHLQNYFKCSLRSLFTNKFVYARDARAQIRPLPRFFRLPNFVLLRAFIAGCMPLYLIYICTSRYFFNMFCNIDFGYLVGQNLLNYQHAFFLLSS